MAGAYCTGAVRLYVGLGGSITSPTPMFLGTCESYPRRDTHRSWDAVMNDIAGSKLPLDYIFEGEECIHSLVLTRWNMDVLNLLEQQPRPWAGAGTRGVTTELDTGAMMATEGLCFQFWTQNAFGGKVAYPLLEMGRRYPQTILWGPDTDESGTRANKKHLIFRSWRKYDPQTRGMLLWDVVGVAELSTSDNSQ